MQMINVLKRLAELDAKNTNVVKESTSVEECGPMGMMDSMGGMEKPSTPASMNITAGSGDELANMLATIMQLAGVKQVGADDLGAEHQPAVMTSEPIAAVGPAASDAEVMRSFADKMHPEMDQEPEMDQDNKKETDESMDGIYDNSAASSQPQQQFDAEAYAHHENDKGAGKGRHTTAPQGNASTFESLMKEYQQFVNE